MAAPRYTASASNSLKKYALKAAEREPQLNTKTREIYDLLMNNKGKPVVIVGFDKRHTILRNLQDNYNLEIRHVKRDTYILAGRYVGADYKDYEHV